MACTHCGIMGVMEVAFFHDSIVAHHQQQSLLVISVLVVCWKVIYMYVQCLSLLSLTIHYTCVGSHQQHPYSL